MFKMGFNKTILAKELFTSNTIKRNFLITMVLTCILLGFFRLNV